MGKYVEMEASVNSSFEAEIAGQKADSKKDKPANQEKGEQENG